ncbi:MAG: D-aminoacylase [Planctomycetes bacterium]|nr:D-aminoacylase [Planctomycetota bacterium]
MLIAFSLVCIGDVAFSGPVLTRTQAAEKFDIVIKNGKIVDGSGAPWYYGDVGIRNGKIARIGRIPHAAGRRTIDAKGLVVAPGFIDMMGQTATPFLSDPKSAFNLLTQGITTINAGEGHSAAPLSPADAKKAGWQTLRQYFALLEKKGIPINVVQTVGHTQIRRLVLGEVDRRPTAAELKRMQSHVREAMHAGAIGVSTALIYPPAVYATTEEIAALAKVAGEFGGRYYTHMRNEGDRLLEAIDEALEIGRTAGTPVHIFHLKAAGRQNWGKMEQAIAKIKAARQTGQQVAADIYPYINNGLGIAAFMHPRNFTQGREKLRRTLDDPQVRARIRKEMESEAGWENWYRHVGFDWNKVVLGSMTGRKFSKYNGRTLAAIAEELKQDPWDTFFEIAKTGAFALPQSMNEANKIRAMKQEFISFCTDVGPASGKSRISAHPRAFGSFPRILAHYVRDLGVISLERAIAQMTSVAANEIMAYDRGRIAVGLAADIVIFDFRRITDRATLANPRVPSQGMKYVLVNGRIVLANGKLTKATPGRVLRGPGYQKQ